MGDQRSDSMDLSDLTDGDEEEEGDTLSESNIASQGKQWVQFYEKWSEVIGSDCPPEHRQWLSDYIGAKIVFPTPAETFRKKGAKGIQDEINDNNARIKTMQNQIVEARKIVKNAKDELVAGKSEVGRIKAAARGRKGSPELALAHANLLAINARREELKSKVKEGEAIVKGFEGLQAELKKQNIALANFSPPKKTVPSKRMGRTRRSTSSISTVDQKDIVIWW